MANSVADARRRFEQLTFASPDLPSHNSGNVTIQAPEKNVTLVLNFGNGFTAPPVPLQHQLSIDSLMGISQTADLQSPSESPSSSTPSTPDINRNVSRSLSIKTEKDTKGKSRQSTKSRDCIAKSPPSRQAAERNVGEQTPINAMIALSHVSSTDVYSESWVKKKHYLSFVKHHRIRDVKFDNDCNVILTSRHSVQLYDTNGHFMERLYLDKIEEPWGIHAHHNGNIFISDHKNDCVQEFTHIGIQVKQYGPVPSPCGVAVSSSHYVFVCSKTDGCIYVFDKKNKLVRKLGEGTLTSPAHIILLGKLVLVSDAARIIGFTTDNSIAFIYGYPENSNHPACLTIDKKTGFALATAYYKSSVIAVKKDMTRALMVKDATRPILCAQSPYGHLLVGERLSKGVQFKMYRSGKDF
ncbi:uncharacterized protein [Watersipora subatra]|uniref:uncharacterized protein n=1 Tax=Watersipora subatra TaxID=2589382 RepID=UPI00355C5540